MLLERIVGVDFGTSTSVIRVKRYQDGAPIGDRLDTMSVVFNMGEAMSPTLVQRTEEGQPRYFGHEARIGHKIEGKLLETCSNFKVELENPDPEKRALARNLTADYLGFLAETYLTQSNGGHLGAAMDNQKTIISYPVKWSEETRNFMVNAAKKAGFPNVEGMDEAQAAICAVTVQNEDLLTQKGYFHAGRPVNILLIDMGAGTTDLVLCRHTPGQKPKTEILCTWPQKGNTLFGGCEVDTLLQNFICGKLSGQIGAQDLARVMRALDNEKFKAWKENTVAPMIAHGDKIQSFTALDTFLNMLGLMANYDFDRTEFENFMQDYLRQFPELVNGCLEKVGISGDDVDLVILTGGHSQWYFVREMLMGRMAQFGEISLAKIKAEPNRIISLIRPQETVALGLVYSPIGAIAGPEPSAAVVESPLRDGTAITNDSCCGDGLTWQLEGNTLTICGIGRMEDYTDDNKAPWDSRREDIQAIILELGVASIGDRAFHECKNLSAITIPDGVTSIGANAFSLCHNLHRVTIPDGVTTIGNEAFRTCSLNGVTIPDSVTSIGARAFYGCPNLNVYYGGTKTDRAGKLKIDSDNQALTSAEWFYNEETQKSRPAESSAARIAGEKGESKFAESSLPKIASGTCGKNLKWSLAGNTLTISGQGMMKDSWLFGLWWRWEKTIRTVVIARGVTSIGKHAFDGCSDLTSVTIPGSVTSIGNSAFAGCSSLISVTIPGSVTSIGNSAFKGCSGLHSVTIPGSITSIGGHAFEGCRGLNSITIPDSVTSIEGWVFQGCSNLNSITFSERVTFIGNGAFKNCSSLDSITIPDCVTFIGHSVFEGCSSLTSITIPGSVTSIGSSAFEGCSGLTSVTIPGSVTFIGSSAFEGCSSLRNVYYGGSEAARAKIKIDSASPALDNAIWHYNG